MTLSYSAWKLVKYVLSFSGEKEVDAKGVEVNSPLRLTGEDASQRRHFTKLFTPIEEEVDGKVKSLVDAYNDLAKKTKEEHVRSVDESEEEYEARIIGLLSGPFEKTQADIVAARSSSYTLDLTDKSKKVIDTYFNAYGERAGFVQADDEYVEELAQALLS